MLPASARALIACALLLLPAGASFGQAGVFRGPLLQDVTGDAVTIMWESPTPVTGTIRYGLNSINENTVMSGPAATHHEVRLTGLSAFAGPGAEIIYELEVGTQQYPGRFFTPVVGSTAFSFLAYGDNRSSETQHQAVVTALLAEQADASFVMNTGDMVSDGEDESHWDTFFTVERPFLSNMPLYAAIGNHEVDGGDWDIGERLLSPPTTLAPASNDESYYHFVYGNVEFIVINVETQTLYTIGILAGDQEEWLEDVLTQRLPGVDHRLVFIHQGPYSSKPGRRGNFWLRQWMEDFRDNGIDVVVSGHDHYAERGFTQTGLYYIIHGGGGAPLYETYGPRVTNDHTIIYGETRLGYVLFSVDGPKLTAELKALNGDIVDTFTYGDTANPGCSIPADCGASPITACPGGAWECRRSACQYACPDDTGLLTCLNDEACEDQISASCAGTITCEKPGINPLEWYCLCELPPECTIDGDCAGRAPPIPDCPGTWACVDETCEFSPDTVCDEPTDAGPPDTGVQDAATSTDAGMLADAGRDDVGLPPDAGVSAPADAGDDAGSAVPLPQDAGSNGDSSDGSCGCHQAQRRRQHSAPALLGLGLLWVLRLRSGRRRSR